VPLSHVRHLRAASALLAGTLAALALTLSSSVAHGSAAGHASAADSLSSAPTGVTATAGVDSAAVSFTPAAAGTPPVGSYTVTAYPGDEQGFGTTSPVSVTGLQPTAAYTFSVTAASTAGRSAGSAPSAPLTPLTPPAGVTPPALSGLAISLVSFFAGSRGGGTAFSYTDSAAATSTLTLLRVRDGSKHARACLVTRAPSAKRCTSLLLVGSFTHVDVAGQNKVHFAGRVDGHLLPAGLYQVRITPNLSGVPGNTLKTEFDIF
jgi:hypothetical protein